MLFKNYIYVSGTSKTLVNNFKEFAEDVITKYMKQNTKKEKCIKILEIACNDGSQLDEIINYTKNKIPDYEIITVGVDPAENIYQQISSKKQHDIYCEFFSQSTIDKLKEKYGNFDIIIAANVFAHIDYPNDFLKFMKQIMVDTSSLYIQTSQKNMIIENQFDTIYHEHLSFFNTNSMKYVCEHNGLFLNHVQENYIHGTSYIFEINTYLSSDRNVDNFIMAETKLGLYNIETYEKYRNSCLLYKYKLKQKLIEYKIKKQNIIAYGSTAKSMTVFNFCGIDCSFIDSMIDENPMKVGLFTPGSNIQVTDLNTLTTIQANTVIIITAWNFYDEIKNKIINHIKNAKRITLLNINSLDEEIINIL
jgi:2-polyprenyl-3-methyl-5-hydroxy-6-metoxy-1,4-benzoquinol methylase